MFTKSIQNRSKATNYCQNKACYYAGCIYNVCVSEAEQMEMWNLRDAKKKLFTIKRAPSYGINRKKKKMCVVSLCH